MTQTKLERGPMVGRMLEGDFEKDTITFHMPATYYLASGRYIIEPEADWVRRKEQLTALSARASAGEGGDELGAAELRSQEQRAMGWDAICNLLFELRPKWTYGAGTGIELAVATIREGLSTPRAAEAVTEGMVDSVRADIMQAAANDGRLHIFLKDEWVRAALTAALTPPSAKGE